MLRRASASSARRARFRYAKVNPDHTRCPEPSELLPVLDELKARQAA
jgi:hypothetical protein